MLDFLDIFAGMVIKIPDKKVLTEMVRSIVIFNYMNKSNTDNTVDELSRRFDIEPKKVRKIYKMTYRKFMQHELAMPDPNIEKFRGTRSEVMGDVDPDKVLVFEPDPQASSKIISAIRSAAKNIDDVVYPSDPHAHLKSAIDKCQIAIASMN